MTEQSLHINMLEMKTIMYVLHMLQGDLHEGQIFVHIIVVVYIKHSSSLKSPSPDTLTCQIVHWYVKRSLKLTAVHVTGADVHP